MSAYPASSPKGHPSRSPTDPDLRTQTSTHGSDSEPEEEARPSHTAEIGTLKKLSVPGGTAWLGSSSGVYFVNTVRRAFSAAFVSNPSNLDDTSEPETVPASEDIITGEDAAGRSFDGGTITSNHNAWWLHDADFHRRIVAAVGRPPAQQNMAMNLVTTFFRTTHPLFPFLHGPKFLDDMNDIYTALSQQTTQQPQASGKPKSFAPRPKRTNSAASTTSTVEQLGNIQSVDPLKLITFQIVINIAALSHGPTPTGGPSLPASSTISSPQALLTLILPLSTTPLLPTIQCLLAAELYLLSTISLRHSSTLAGLVLRLIYHTGLHRCPLRYASLTPQECEIRKRIFWSAYALDRHLSLALGDPNTFQDSDIDVCLSRGRDGELHRAVARDLLTEEEKEVEMKLHYPRDSAGKRVILVDSGTQNPVQRLSTNLPDGTSDANKSTHHADENTPAPKPTPESIPASTNSADLPFIRTKHSREAALTAYVRYGRLTGRIIEIFHKSINFRFPKEDAISFLSADIENWWNDLPSTLTGDSNPSTSSATNLSNPESTDLNDDIPPGLLEQHRSLTPFFTLLYHQLLLLLNRPRLSLDQSTASFHQGLQTCIRASRATLSSLHQHRMNGQSMFLPGLLSATWMSGLIIAFACQLGKYPKQRACDDIKSCLGLLGGMGKGWYTVRNCMRVLELLLGNIKGRKPNTRGNLPAGRSEGLGVGMNVGARTQSRPDTTTRKRTRDSIALDNASVIEPSPKRDSQAAVSPASTSDFRPRRFRSTPDTRTVPNLPTQGSSSNIDPTVTSFLRNDPVPSDAGFQFPGPSPSHHQTRNQTPHAYHHNHTHSHANPQQPINPLHGLPSTSNPTTSSSIPANIQSTHHHHHHYQPPTSSGAALYATPKDIISAQSNHAITTTTTNTTQDDDFDMMNLPDMSSTTLDDQMFWGNMDGNLFDVFGAVSWESMTGTGGPMVGVGGGGGGGMGMGIGMGGPWDFGDLGGNGGGAGFM